MWRLQGVQLAEETEQQGRVNAALSAMVAATLAVALALPGVHENCAPAIAAIMVVCAAWAPVPRRFVPWQTAPSWLPHSTALGGLAMAGVGMWASAGHLTHGR